MNQTQAQYLDELCPRSKELANQDKYEDLLIQLNQCLKFATNKSDSMLIYANMPFALRGQKNDKQADSIINILIRPENQQYYKSYVLALERIGRKYMFTEKNKAINNFLLGDSVSLANNFPSGIARSKANVANLYYVLFRDFDNAYKYYIESLKYKEIPQEYHFNTISGAFLASFKSGQKDVDSIQALGFEYINENLSGSISSNDSSKVSIFYGMVGRNYFNIGQLRLALEQNLNAVEMKPKSTAYKYGLNQLYLNIANIFISLSNPEKAMEYAQLISDNSEKYNFESYKIQAIILKAKIYYQQGSFENAKKNYKEFIYQNQESKINENPLLLTAYADLALIYCREDSLTLSKIYLDKAEILMKEMDSSSIPLLKYYSALTEYLLKNEKYSLAAASAQSILDLSIQLNDADYKKVSAKYLSEISLKKKNFKKAYEYQYIYHQIEDSLFRNEQNYIVHDLEAKYLKKEQDLTINQLQFEDDKNKSRISAQRRTITIGAIGLGLVSLLSFLLFRFGRKIKFQNNIIEKSLSEKELLLKEIHHRVKNNLQVVSSLLSLQSEYIKDDTALSAINEGRNRVRSMALIHQNLYSEDNLTGINVKSYLEKLIEGLFNTYNINEDQITLGLNIEDIALDVDIVVPLGLIANELVSNSLKHAFTEQSQGRITVSLTTDINGLAFRVNDNGKGVDTSLNIKDMESFGYQMIYAFKEKLQAKLFIENNDGTSVSLFIKNYQKNSDGK
jgi:two-component sensor histidine kinase/tetratricopeptide (TPR) repeat protein